MPTINVTRVLATVFILNIIEFLQAGMISFAANPIMGETSTSPEEFGLISAVYACIAILMIATQHWIVERIGWRSYLQLGLLFFITGATLCTLSDSFYTLITGRAIMGIGGASFMTSARLLTLILPIGAIRFKGIQLFVISMTLGTSLAPLLASQFISAGHWQWIFILLMTTACIALIVVSFSVPSTIIKQEERTTKMNPLLILALIVGGFAFFYVFRGENFSFYSNTMLLFGLFIFSIISLSLFFARLKYTDDRPLLHVKLVFQDNAFAIGTTFIMFIYIMFGANNYILPMMLQRGLNFSWSSVGLFNSLGLSTSILSWFFFILLIRKKPGIRKFCFFGALAVCFYGYVLSHVTPQASLPYNILPAFCATGVFTILLMSPLTMAGFRAFQENNLLFSHALQIRNMLAQLSISLGITLGTVFMQWRTTQHFSSLGENFSNNSSIYTNTLQQLTQALSRSLSQEDAIRAATAQLQQMLIQQSTLMASIDYFHCVMIFGIIFAILIYCQKKLQ